MQDAASQPERQTHPDWVLFLALKPGFKFGKTCQSDQRVCKRPWWSNDGRVDGDFFGLCSRCWHEYNAFHGKYVTTMANPAAAKLSLNAIRNAMLFGAGELPPNPSDECPDAPPTDW